MRELVIVRTHYADAAVLEFFDYLARTSNRDVAFVCDETKGVVDVGPGRVKVGITPEYTRAMGLYTPDNYGWLCGDYFIYVGAKAFPGYDRYWLVEADVRFNMSICSSFFDSFTPSDADIIACHTFRSGGNWYWHKPMSYFCDEVHACMFPLIGISSNAVTVSLESRIHLSNIFDEVVPKSETRRWPNDESFVMTTLMAQGLKCISINSGDRKFTSNETFSVGVPKSLAALAARLPDGMIYHPVQSKDQFVKKARSWALNARSQNMSAERVTEMFNEKFFSDLLLEGTAAHVQEIKNLLGQQPERE